MRFAAAMKGPAGKSAAWGPGSDSNNAGSSIWHHAISVCPGPCAEELQGKGYQFCTCTQSPLLWGTASVTLAPSRLKGTCPLLGPCCQILTRPSPEQPTHTDPGLEQGLETSGGDHQPALQGCDLGSLTLPCTSEVSARAGVRGCRHATALGRLGYPQMVTATRKTSLCHVSQPAL